MVGDSISDIAMAKAAEIPVIAVDYGYTPTPVAELGADRIIGRLADLPGAVLELMGGPKESCAG
jgi:phosphoglycolate phosphatase